MSAQKPVGAASEPGGLPVGQTTAVALVVAPEGYEQAVAAVPADELPALIWWLDQIIQRANAARKCALVEAEMAMSRSELLNPTLTANGHRYVLRQDSRTDWDDIPGLFYVLERMGVSVGDLARAVNGVRVTDLRSAVSKIDDPDTRKDALETVEQHRVKKATQLALVDLDATWRR